MPPTVVHALVAAAVALCGWLLLRRVVLWRRYAKRRARAAHKRRYADVLEWGRRQMAVGAPDTDCLNDMAVALRRTGEMEEAFAYALRVQQRLSAEHLGHAPAHPEDWGDPAAFQNAEPRYLRSMRILGHGYLERARPEEAEAVFAYLVGLGGRYVECNVDLAEARLRTGDAAGAVEALRRLMRVDPVTGAKRIRSEFDRLLASAPASPELQAFRAEFLSVEGRTGAEFDRLAGRVRSGDCAPDELLLAHELARKEGRLPELAAALDEAGPVLAERTDLRDRLFEVADAAGALRLQLGLCEAELDACLAGGAPDRLPAVRDAIGRHAEKAVSESPGLAEPAALLLARTGRIEPACRLLGVSLAPGDAPQDGDTVRALLRQAAHRQRLVEIPRLLAGRVEPYDPVPAGEGGRVLLVRPSDRYRAALAGEGADAGERRRLAYDLSGAVLATGEGRQHLTRLLQEVAASDSPCAEPAAIRLARLFSEDGDRSSADQYRTRFGSIARAAEVAREDVLDDAYTLARSLEHTDPANALALYRSVAMVDVSFRDARTRRDRLQEMAEHERTEVGAASQARDAADSWSPGATVDSLPGADPLDAGGVDELLAGFGGGGAAGSDAPPGGLPQAGEEIDGRYRVEAVIGEGGMGAVYRAFDNRLERTVAVKVIRPGLSDDILRAGERFQLEARLAGKLFQHGGVVTVLDLGDGPPPYIVMEYVEGDSLRDLLLERELTAEEAGTVLYQVADTLGYAHAQGVVHRDLKPANIMVEPMPLRTRVADFGLAKLMDAANRLTMSGAVVGTRMYMSPEQIQGDKVDGRCDIYAWGCLAYELVTGSPPFTQGELSYQHVYAKPPPLADHPRAKEFPPAFLALVMRCLAKKRDDRPESFGHVKADLREQFADLKTM